MAYPLLFETRGYTNSLNHVIKLLSIIFQYSIRIMLCMAVPLICLYLSTNANAKDNQTLYPDKNKPVEFVIKENKPIDIEIDTTALKDQIHGKIPIKFKSEHDQTFFTTDGKESRNIYWHSTGIPIATGSKSSQASSDRYIYLRLDTNEEMVGKKVRIFLEKEENLSKVAVVGAFVPQVIPIIAMNTVTWQPHSFWPSLLRWNYLLLELDLIHSIRKFIQSQVFEDNNSLFAQCSADFVEGFTEYALLANHGNTIVGDPNRPSAAEARANDIPKNAINRSKQETFRLYLRAAPTTRLLDCISSVVSTSLKTLHNEARLHEVFGKWPMLDTLNDQTIDGVAMLMVGYGFNLLGSVPGDTLSLIRGKLGFEHVSGLTGDFNDAIKNSIQYTIHNGYMKFFKGRGWDPTSAYALSAGVGLLELGYRFYQVKRMIPIGEDETFDPLNTNLQHQIVSIGERAEAIVASGYQVIPLPESIKGYVVPAAAVTILPIVTFYAVDGLINYYATGGFNIALQRALTHGTNALVLGAMLYIILPHVKEYGAWLTQLAADELVSWTDAEKDSWIGYFAARDIQYKIRVDITN